MASARHLKRRWCVDPQYPGHFLARVSIAMWDLRWKEDRISLFQHVDPAIQIDLYGALKHVSQFFAHMLDEVAAVAARINDMNRAVEELAVDGDPFEAYAHAGFSTDSVDADRRAPAVPGDEAAVRIIFREHFADRGAQFGGYFVQCG